MDKAEARTLKPGDKVRLIDASLYNNLAVGDIHTVLEIREWEDGSDDPRIIIEGHQQIFYPYRFEKVDARTEFKNGDRVRMIIPYGSREVGEMATVRKGFVSSAYYGSHYYLDVVWDDQTSGKNGNGGYDINSFELVNEQRTAREVVNEVMDKFAGVSDVVTEEILTALNREFNLS